MFTVSNEKKKCNTKKTELIFNSLNIFASKHWKVSAHSHVDLCIEDKQVRVQLLGNILTTDLSILLLFY